MIDCNEDKAKHIPGSSRNWSVQVDKTPMPGRLKRVDSADIMSVSTKLTQSTKSTADSAPVYSASVYSVKSDTYYERRRQRSKSPRRREERRSQTIGDLKPEEEHRHGRPTIATGQDDDNGDEKLRMRKAASAKFAAREQSSGASKARVTRSHSERASTYMRRRADSFVTLEEVLKRKNSTNAKHRRSPTRASKSQGGKDDDTSTFDVYPTIKSRQDSPRQGGRGPSAHSKGNPDKGKGTRERPQLERQMGKNRGLSPSRQKLHEQIKKQHEQRKKYSAHNRRPPREDQRSMSSLVTRRSRPLKFDLERSYDDCETAERNHPVHMDRTPRKPEIESVVLSGEKSFTNQTFDPRQRHIPNENRSRRARRSLRDSSMMMVERSSTSTVDDGYSLDANYRSAPKKGLIHSQSVMSVQHRPIERTLKRHSSSQELRRHTVVEPRPYYGASLTRQSSAEASFLPRRNILNQHLLGTQNNNISNGNKDNHTLGPPAEPFMVSQVRQQQPVAFYAITPEQLLHLQLVSQNSQGLTTEQHVKPNAPANDNSEKPKGLRNLFGLRSKKKGEPAPPQEKI